MSILDEIKRKSGGEFRRADDRTIQAFRALGAPEDALAFFRESEPARCAEINKVRLWPISELIVENTDSVPGSYAQPCGYVVFATTIYGDTFCFDTRTGASPASAPVVLLAHSLEPNPDAMTREELAPLAKPIASNFESFLAAFAVGTLDIEPVYPKFDW